MQSKQNKNLAIHTDNTEEHFTTARDLFTQYAQSLEIDLAFQGFSKELESIREQYSAPTGTLLLCYKAGLAVGCIAVRRLDDGVAELKRMFVQEEYRKYGIGQMLLTGAIHAANALGYKYIRLDTLATMKKALDLYRSAGFYEIPSYRYNPVPDAVFMEKRLA